MDYIALYNPCYMGEGSRREGPGDEAKDHYCQLYCDICEHVSSNLHRVSTFKLSDVSMVNISAANRLGSGHMCVCVCVHLATKVFIGILPAMG